MKTPSNPALNFAKRINAHDVEGLTELMTPDYTFIDSLGEKFTSPAIDEGWRQYFAMVPDYWIEVDRSFRFHDIAILIGRAGGTYVHPGGAMKPKNRWETPAVWVVRSRGRHVAEWRIYCDNEPIRLKMESRNDAHG